MTANQLIVLLEMYRGGRPSLGILFGDLKYLVSKRLMYSNKDGVYSMTPLGTMKVEAILALMGD